MRYFLLFFVISIVGGSVLAQTIVYDKVELGPQYIHQSFYSMKEGEKANVTNTGWDLQFATAQRSASIRINDAKFVELYLPVDADTSRWLNVDTTGMTQLFNADTSWEYGAFNNVGTRQHPDYGCLYYVNTGQLRGHRIFVIKLHNGQYKKIWIKSLDFYEYTIVIGNLDNTDEQVIKLDKSQYSTKSFVYFDLENGEVKNLEPASEDWDIVFRKYYAMDSITFQPFNRVTGVLSNLFVQVAEARGVLVDTLMSDAGYTYTNRINEIGYDWKHYDYTNMVYELDDDVAYFVKTRQGEIYKIVFTGFTGSVNGRIDFYKTKIETSASSVADKGNATLSSLGVYPNPSNAITHVLVSLNQPTHLYLSMHNLEGKMLWQKDLQASWGLNNFVVDVSNLAVGLYLLKVSNGTEVLIHKLLVAQ